MLTTYKALLKGDRLEWSDETPALVSHEQPAPVLVTILEESVPAPKHQSQGHCMASALERLAALGSFRDIGDAAAWEREARQDRELPGRES